MQRIFPTAVYVYWEVYTAVHICLLYYKSIWEQILHWTMNCLCQHYDQWNCLQSVFSSDLWLANVCLSLRHILKTRDGGVPHLMIHHHHEELPLTIIMKSFISPSSWRASPHHYHEELYLTIIMKGFTSPSSWRASSHHHHEELHLTIIMKSFTKYRCPDIAGEVDWLIYFFIYKLSRWASGPERSSSTFKIMIMHLQYSLTPPHATYAPSV